MAQSIACLRTTFKNVSGVATQFSFLPPHGRLLPINGEITVPGGPVEAVRRGARTNNNRMITALENALLAGKLEIISTPNPVFYDVANDDTKMMKINAAIPYTVDPCWNTTSVSAAFP